MDVCEEDLRALLREYGLIDPHEENQHAIETALGPVSANERCGLVGLSRSKPITLKSAQFLVEAPGGEKCSGECDPIFILICT